jgi:hypothetical protein
MGGVAYYLTLYRKGGGWLIAGGAHMGMSPASTEWADVRETPVLLQQIRELEGPDSLAWPNTGRRRRKCPDKTRKESEGAEFLVLGQLLIQGIPAYKTHTNLRGYDLVAAWPETKRVARIQVKSRCATTAPHSVLPSASLPPPML